MGAYGSARSTPFLKLAREAAIALQPISLSTDAYCFCEVKESLQHGIGGEEREGNTVVALPAVGLRAWGRQRVVSRSTSSNLCSLLQSLLMSCATCMYCYGGWGPLAPGLPQCTHSLSGFSAAGCVLFSFSMLQRTRCAPQQLKAILTSQIHSRL